MEDRRDRPVADGEDDRIFDRWVGRIPAHAVGHARALGDRLQAGQVDDLGALQGGGIRAGRRALWGGRRRSG